MLCLQDIIEMSECTEQEITDIVVKKRVPEVVAYVMLGQQDQSPNTKRINHEIVIREAVKAKPIHHNHETRTFRHIPGQATMINQAAYSNAL